MMRRLNISPRARREVNDAADWYELQYTGLGERFTSAYEQALAAIADNPFQYQAFGQSARRAGLHRFPHGLIYTISDEEIVIVACLHGRRDPRFWRG